MQWYVVCNRKAYADWCQLAHQTDHYFYSTRPGLWCKCNNRDFHVLGLKIQPVNIQGVSPLFRGGQVLTKSSIIHANTMHFESGSQTERWCTTWVGSIMVLFWEISWGILWDVDKMRYPYKIKSKDCHVYGLYTFGICLVQTWRSVQYNHYRLSHTNYCVTVNGCLYGGL